MGKILRRILWASLVIVLMGCTAASREMWLKSQSERKDVFSDSVKEPIPSGMAELHIRASIKIKLERQFVRGSSIAGRGYPFLINIDGQATTWRVYGQRERYGETGHESGEGLRYILERNLTLSAGLHKIFFGLPEEDTFVQFEVTMEGGQSYVLEFKPFYGECITGHKKFSHGVDRLEVLLNGNPICPQTNG